jgi:hypothetical protein
VEAEAAVSGGRDRDGSAQRKSMHSVLLYFDDFHNLSYACTYSKGIIHVHTKYSNRTSK